MATAVTWVIGSIMVLFHLGAAPAAQNRDMGKRESSAVVTTVKMEVALCKARQRLEEVIGIVKPGTCIHYATAGDWATHDLVLHLAAQTGPIHLAMSTWSISEPAVRQIVRALGDGRILSLGLLADWRVLTHCPEAHQLASAIATRCRIANVHAKVAVLHSATAQICIVTTGNLTHNPRIEAGVIAHDPVAAAFHRRWIEAELDNASPFDLSGARARGEDDNG